MNDEKLQIEIDRATLPCYGYYIIYPQGDKNKLYVLEYDETNRYDLSDYKLAYREKFYDRAEAVSVAKKLALKHSKEFVPENDEDDYLEL